MKTLSKLLSEKATKRSWDGHPKIGWWEDAKPLIMYHGTHESNLESILKNGIYAPSEGYTAGYVSLALEPNTAFGYASMSGGEKTFRTAGSKAKIIPPSERVVLVLEFKNGVKDLEKMGLGKIRGAMSETRGKLSDKSEYEKHTGDDQSYYALTELRIKKKVPAKFIKGYMKK